MREAFTYMFKDNKLLSKTISLLAPIIVIFALVILSGIAKSQFLGVIVVLSIIFTLLSFAGYFISCVKAITLQDSNIVLPKLNLVNNFISGVKPAFASIIAGIIVSLSGYPIVFIAGLTNNKSLIIIITLLYFLLLFLYNALMPAFIWIFAKTEKFWSYINFKLAFKLITKNIKKYIFAVLTHYVPVILLSILNHIVKQSKELTSMTVIVCIMLLIFPFCIYIQAYACAKSINKECLEEL